MTPIIIGSAVGLGLWILTRGGDATAATTDPAISEKELLDLGAGGGVLTSKVTMTDGTIITRNEGGTSTLVDVGFTMEPEGENPIHVDAAGGEISAAELDRRIEQAVSSGFLGDLII